MLGTYDCCGMIPFNDWRITRMREQKCADKRVFFLPVQRGLLLALSVLLAGITTRDALSGRNCTGVEPRAMNS